MDFANENYVWKDFTIERDGRKKWIFNDEEIKMLFADESVISLGHNWYEHDKLKKYKIGIERISKETRGFFKSLGYEHIGHTGKYKVLRQNNKRVALFAHQGFGIAFLSEILDIPYPVFANHFDICHTGMTVIEFKEENEIAIPRVLTLSSDSHIYHEGLPTKYNGEISF